MAQSKRHQLSQADYQRIGRNAVIFFGPVAITALGLFINGTTEPKVYAVAVAIWAQGVIVDVLRKWNSGK